MILLDLIWAMGRFVRGCFSLTFIVIFYRVAFNSPVNAAIVTRLVKEVQTLNHRYQAHTIKGKCVVMFSIKC